LSLNYKTTLIIVAVYREDYNPNPAVLVPAHKKSPIFRLSFFCELTGTKPELFFGRFEAFEPIERKSTPKRYQGTFL